MPEVCTNKIKSPNDKEETPEDKTTPINSNTNKCIGCGLFIQDQYIFKVLPDMQWHENCLKCQECMCKLNENTTCFIKNGMAYCKTDYMRLFSIKCDKCGHLVKRNDLIMKSRSKTFHYECFSCNICLKKLKPGDEYQMINDLLYCKDDLALAQTNSASIQFGSPTYLNNNQPHHNTQLYLGNIQNYAQNSTTPSTMLTPESSAFSPNTNSSNSIGSSSASSVVDSPSSVNLSNSSRNHSYLFNSTSNQLNIGSTTLPNQLNGYSEQTARVSNGFARTNFDLHDKEDDNSVVSDADDLDENEVDNDDDDDLDENFDDEDSFNEDNNSLNESSHSIGLKTKKTCKKSSKKHLKQNYPSSISNLPHHHNNFHNDSSSPLSNSLLQINNRFLDNPHHYHGQHHHHSGNSSSSSSKPARIRTVLNEKQLHTLRACYNANPRPDALMKEQLVEMTGLNPRVIRVWFQNKRCKDKKKNMLVRPEHPLQLPTHHHNHHHHLHHNINSPFNSNTSNTSNNLISSHQHNLMFDNCY